MSQNNNGSAKQQNEEEFIIYYEPFNAEERQRNDNVPVGLKNIGNSKQQPDFDNIVFIQRAISIH